MRIRNVLLALAVLALVAPSSAEAKGGRWEGPGKGFKGLGRGGKAGSGLFEGSRQRVSRLPPRPGFLSGPSTRSATPRSTDLFRGQGVPGGGHRTFSSPSRSPLGGGKVAEGSRMGSSAVSRNRAPAGRLFGGGSGAKAADPRPGTLGAATRREGHVGKDGFMRGLPVGPAVGQGVNPTERAGIPLRSGGFSTKGGSAGNTGGGSAWTGGSGANAGGGSAWSGGSHAGSGSRSAGGTRSSGGTPSFSGGAGGWRSGYRVGHRDGRNDHYGYHDWYDHNRWSLSFRFGACAGPYLGVSYYHPFRHWALGVDYAFFYPAPVTHCYVPFGFYDAYRPVYVTRYEVVRETVPTYVYETRTTRTEEEIEEAEAAGTKGPVDDAPAEGEAKVAEPKPAAGSPATEKFLREASGEFKEKDYYEAAVKFRLAALSSPDEAAPLFALGQALVALGHDDYAARVIRKAVAKNPRILEETADIAGVYESQAEYDRVMGELEARAAKAPVDGDARFLLGAARYFAGDPRCRDDLRLFHEARPEDEAVNLMRDAVEKRFKAAEDLPPLPPPAPVPAK